MDEFDDASVAGRLYSGSFPLVDVTVIPDEEIVHHRSMAALTLLQKHIRQRDLADLMGRLVPVLLLGYHTPSQIVSLVHYIVQAGETSDAEAFVRELAHHVPQHGDALMTIAEQLEQKGIQIGERKAALRIALTMLQSGVDRQTVLKLTGLKEDDLAQIAS